MTMGCGATKWAFTTFSWGDATEIANGCETPPHRCPRRSCRIVVADVDSVLRRASKGGGVSAPPFPISLARTTAMDTPHEPPSSTHALLATLAIALLGTIGAVVMALPPSA